MIFNILTLFSEKSRCIIGICQISYPCGSIKGICSRHILFLEENIINPCSAWDQVSSCYFPSSLIYFFTRTMNWDSDFKRRARWKLWSVFKSTPRNCLKHLVVVLVAGRQWRQCLTICFIISSSQHQQHLNSTSNPHISFSKVGGVVQSIIAGGKASILVN